MKKNNIFIKIMVIALVVMMLFPAVYSVIALFV